MVGCTKTAAVISMKVNILPLLLAGCYSVLRSAPCGSASRSDRRKKPGLHGSTVCVLAKSCPHIADFGRTLAMLLTLVALGTTQLASANTVLEIDLKATGPEINKNIYGQFAEHLGRGIYEGIWVGKKSKIPNQHGYRTDVINALKDLQVPLIRWPGGCFADEYHWRDGIGPPKKRITTTNAAWGGVTDSNAFGTHEFLDLAELLGAEVYINGNLGTGTPQEMAQWLEYMTATGNSALAKLRRANGREKPWRIHYFAIGNESWGCGGTMTPEYYANLYKHYATFAKTPEDNRPIMIASGGHTDLTNWTDTLIQLKPLWSYRLEAIAHHYYTLPTGNWDKKGSALGFKEDQWFSTLQQTLLIDDYIQKNLAIMDKYEPEKKVGFYIDEWGTWYDTPEGENSGILYQQNSIRDAVVAALNLNIFHQYADRIKMTNIAQMVNVLQAMILTDHEKILLTPTYYVYKMHIPFQGATSIRTNIKHLPLYQFEGKSIAGLSASAALDHENQLWLSLVNTNPNQAADIAIETGEKLHSATGHLLTGNSLDAHNTFAEPNTVKPVAYHSTAVTGNLVLRIPAKSIVVVAIQ